MEVLVNNRVEVGTCLVTPVRLSPATQTLGQTLSLVTPAVSWSLPAVSPVARISRLINSRQTAATSSTTT